MLPRNHKLLFLTLMAASPSCYSVDFHPKCYSLYERDVSGIPMTVDEAVLRVVSIESGVISTIGTSFYVGDFRDGDGKVKAGFLTAAHVLEDAKERGNWGLVTCGNDKPEDVMQGVEVIYVPLAKTVSDIAAIALEKTDNPFFETVGAKPIAISARFLGDELMLGESAWWSGYSKHLPQKSPPKIYLAEWRSIPIETRYSLFSANAAITPSGGASGSPVLRKTPSGGLEAVGVIAITPATAEEKIDEILMRHDDRNAVIDHSIANDMAKAPIAGSRISPSHPALLRVVGESLCERSLLDAVRKRDALAFGSRAKNCFGGSQPVVSAFRFIRWLEKAGIEDQKFVLMNGRSGLQAAVERTGSPYLVQMLTAALSKAESAGAGYATSLPSIDYARSIFNAIAPDEVGDIEAQRSAIKTLETELYAALSSTDLLSDRRRRYVYSGLVDAYKWRRDRGLFWQESNPNESSKIGATSLLCATELAPKRALAWDAVADLFMRSGQGDIAATAFAIKARHSGDKVSTSTALSQCQSLARNDPSICNLTAPDALSKATSYVMKHLAKAAGHPEPGENQSGFCAQFTAPLRDAIHGPLGEITRMADLRLEKLNDVLSDNVVSGMTTTYSLRVWNYGPDDADGAVLHDPAPNGLTCTSVSCDSTGSAECPVEKNGDLLRSLQTAGVVIPRLPAGGSIEVILTCTID